MVVALWAPGGGRRQRHVIPSRKPIIWMQSRTDLAVPDRTREGASRRRIERQWRDQVLRKKRRPRVKGHVARNRRTERPRIAHAFLAEIATVADIHHQITGATCWTLFALPTCLWEFSDYGTNYYSRGVGR